MDAQFFLFKYRGNLPHSFVIDLLAPCSVDLLAVELVSLLVGLRPFEAVPGRWVGMPSQLGQLPLPVERIVRDRSGEPQGEALYL